MEQFKISDIQELFEADVERFHSRTLSYLTELLTQTPAPMAALDEALRETHTLKGLAGTLHATGLAGLGGDYECLLELAGTWLRSEPARAAEVFQFIVDHQQDWFVMNQFSCMAMLPQAWELYLGLRTAMEEHWHSYLPPRPADPGESNLPLRLVELEPATEPIAPQTPAPDLDVRLPAPVGNASQLAPPTALRVVPPKLKSRAPKLTPTNLPPEVKHSHDLPAKPTPLQVVPPNLIRRNLAEVSTETTTEPISSGSNPTGKQVVPKTLANANPTTDSAPPAAPPILRVAPPRLKRRVQVEVIEPAGISEPAAAATTKMGAAEFKPGADADLLALLGQEIAGYLTELSSRLAILATDLAPAPEWETTRRLFHTIKGTAATFNLDAVSVPAKAGEACCVTAIESASARTAAAFETCCQRAQVIAKALRLPFTAPKLATLPADSISVLPPGAPVPENIAAIQPEMAEFFIRDARDQTQLIEQAVLRWEQGEKPTEQLWAAQRGFHTLKGAANAIGLTAIAQSVHEVEAFLENVATAGSAGSRALFTFLLGAVDQVRHYLGALANNPAAAWRNDWAGALQSLSQPTVATPAIAASTAIPAATSTDPAEEEANTLRVEASRLYELMNLLGELVVDRTRLEKKIEQLTTLHRALDERNSSLKSSVQSFQQEFEFNRLQQRSLRERGLIPGGQDTLRLLPGVSNESEFSELEFDRYDQFNILARSLVEVSHDIEQLNEEVAGCLDSFSADNVRFTQTSQSLQNKVTNLSLVPVHTLFPRLQRAFRDALNVEHKEADLALQGGDARLDKVVVDRIYAPLLHLLRNAAAHGIEDAITREHRKKPARGQVRFSATQISNQIVIQIADDGGGVNAEAVRQRAIAKGWLAADAPALTAEQLTHFIFQPGFSTATQVNSVAGRGIGLDVVRKEIESLNGAVELQTDANLGSTWTLRLPLTLSISEAILADVCGTTFAFPLNFIESGLILDRASTRDENGRELYAETPEAAALPVLRLAELFQLADRTPSNKGLIVAVGDRRAIVVVDLVLARQEIVVKQLDALTAEHPLLNGATLDAEGGVIPILNLPTLLKFVERSQPLAARPQPRRSPQRMELLRVLIVDDSLSVRKVQERMLTDLGCKVTTAADGLFALEKLREAEFDLIFTDLEMPRMNGYELISDLQANPAWAATPVVVISSRGADKYITKAMNLGAATFLSKPFTAGQLQEVLTHYANRKLAGQLTT